MQKRKRNKGFTLIELLIVIAVMAILTTVVFVALNPLARFEDARNDRRSTDVNAILSAIKLDQVDNGGSYYSAIGSTTADLYYQIGTASAGCSITCSYPTKVIQAACVDLTALVTEGYMPSVPIDPTGGSYTAANTGYYLMRSSNGAIEIGACNEEQGSYSGAEPKEIKVAR